MSKYNLEITAFLTGFCVMALELTGVRILAPYFGTSMYVWTSIIGIVLGALSLGYYYGGKFADRNPNIKTLSIILFSASIYIFIVALFKDIFLSFFHFYLSDIRNGSLVAVLILLGFPSLLLGMVTPFVVRLSLSDVKKGGRVTGRLYSISTIGSILGTFLVGFYFFDLFGNTKILVLISTLLILAVLVLRFKKINLAAMFTIFIFLISFLYIENINSYFFGKNFIDVDTKYNRVWIYEQEDNETGRIIKYMKIDPFFVQSAEYVDSDDLVFEYTKVFSTDEKIINNIKDGLVLGGAAYTYPKVFLKKFPDAKLDVVEIDPGLTKLAKEHFKLKESENLNIYHDDARIILNNSKEKYDVIYVDVFSSAGSVPFHMTTKEAVVDLDRLLKNDGIIFVNLISAPKGDSSEFFNALASTYKFVFDNVFFTTPNNKSEDEIQNIVLLVFNNSNKININELNYKFKEFNSINSIILTDNYAPIEKMLLPIIREKSI